MNDKATDNDKIITTQHLYFNNVFFHLHLQVKISNLIKLQVDELTSAPARAHLSSTYHTVLGESRGIDDQIARRVDGIARGVVPGLAGVLHALGDLCKCR